jgi:hypothetical protein
MLHKHHGKETVIIIDEYDTPIQQGYVHSYYDEVIGFIRNLFSGAFKDNPHLAYGFLTGILRVVKESIFSGMNNLQIRSVLDESYSEYFGFTQDEVREMAAYMDDAIRTLTSLKVRKITGYFPCCCLYFSPHCQITLS